MPRHVPKVRKRLPKPGNRFPVFSIIFTIAMIICWILFVNYAYGAIQAFSGMSNVEADAENVGEAIGDIVGIIAMPAVIAQFIAMAALFFVLALVFTILTAVGWSRKRPW